MCTMILIDIIGIFYDVCRIDFLKKREKKLLASSRDIVQLTNEQTLARRMAPIICHPHWIPLVDYQSHPVLILLTREVWSTNVYCLIVTLKNVKLKYYVINNFYIFDLM